MATVCTGAASAGATVAGKGPNVRCSSTAARTRLAVATGAALVAHVSALRATREFAATKVCGGWLLYHCHALILRHVFLVYVYFGLPFY